MEEEPGAPRAPRRFSSRDLIGSVVSPRIQRMLSVKLAFLRRRWSRADPSEDAAAEEDGASAHTRGSSVAASANTSPEPSPERRSRRDGSQPSRASGAADPMEGGAVRVDVQPAGLSLWRLQASAA